MNLATHPPLPKRFARARVIGEGAVGIVYEVWDSIRGESLALKTLHKATPNDIREFKREFRTAAGLSHPNLVVLHELFFEESLWFFTMELVRGSRLVDSQRTSRTRATHEGLRGRFLQLARGVHALHQAGILHRDIKPDNVLVERGGRVVLLDFGLVAELQPGQGYRDTENVLVGSPGYMAPEQIFGGQLTPASDWYSFGSTLYEAITGALPFEDQAGSSMVRKLSGEARPLSDFGTRVPQDIERLCMALLAREPAARPDASEVMRILGAPAAPLRPPQMPSAEQPQTIVGRHEELQAIPDWLSPRQSARPRLAVLRGPSGIGKTTLARAVLQRLQADDAWVLRSRCLPQEAVPFNAWDGLIDELSDALHAREGERGPTYIDGALPRLFPVLGSLQGLTAHWDDAIDDPIEARNEGMRALRELLLTLGAERPLVLFIDDIQWADADSLRLLRELVLAQKPPNLRLLATLRTEGPERCGFAGLLDESAFGACCKVFDVGPLKALDAASLLNQLGVLEPHRQDRVLSEACGSPFLLSELARWEESSPPGSAIHLSSVLEHRLKALPKAARDLFEVVGLLGRPVPVEVAMNAASIHTGQLEAVHRLRASGLLLVRGPNNSELEPYHDRWRAALRELLDETQCKQRFAALAAAFEGRGAEQDAEILATCYRASGQHTRAATYALAAAVSAEATLAFDRAARCYESALDLGEWRESRRIELLTKLAAMAQAAGRGAQAGRAFRRAAKLTAGGQRISLLRRSAQSFLSSGRQPDGEAVLDEVLRAVDSGRPSTGAAALALCLWERWRLRARGLTWRPQALTERARLRLEALDVVAATWVQHDPIVSWMYGQRLLRLALDGDDERLLLRALSHELVLASSEIHDSRWLDALTNLGRSLSETVNDRGSTAWFEHALGMRTFLAGDWEDAMRQLGAAERRLRTQCTAVHWELCQARQRYVAAVQIAGDMAAPQADIRDWLENAEQRDDRESIVGHLFGLGYCFLANDEPVKIWPLIDRVRNLIGQGHDAAFEMSWLEALTLCYQDAPVERLKASLQSVRAVHKRMQGRVLLYRVWSRGYEARLLGALAVRSEGAAQRRVLVDIRKTRKSLLAEKWYYAACVARTLEATVELFEGRTESAAALLEDSATIHAQQGARLFAAVARHASAWLCNHPAALERARQELRALNVVDVDRMARAHLPAFYRDLQTRA